MREVLILNKIKKAINNPQNIISYILNSKISRFIPAVLFMKIKYRFKLGKKLNLNQPKSFNEKLQWLKIYDKNPIYTKLVDKYEVREYISEIIGDEYLIPLLGVWNTFDKIDFSKLPNQFVLKCTHDSGGIIICKDKNKLDIEKAREKINKSLKRNYYYSSKEWPYKNVKPRIICEKYMLDESGVELKDYKCMCFNGNVNCIFANTNRYGDELYVTFFDREWNELFFERHYHKDPRGVNKPVMLNKMIKLAEVLSKELTFVRVDFYEVYGKIYFGELTFYPGSGFEEFTPVSYDYLLGSWIELSSK